MNQLRLLALATCCAAAIATFGTSHACDAHKSNKGTSASAASATMDCCATKSAKSAKGSKVSATNAASGACSMTKSASASKDCCMTKGATASAKTAGVAEGGCADHAMAMDCSACEDWAMCETQIGSIGGRSQVQALKNGVMIVYLAEGAEGVRAVQEAVARRGEGMKSSMASRKADAKLCGTCKQLRGALASGKLHREVVNIEKGAMDLLTSSDKAVVQMIHSMTGAQIAAR